MSWWNWQKMGGAIEGDSSGFGKRILFFSQLEVFGAGDLGSLTTCHTSTVLGVRQDRGSVTSSPQPVQLQGLAFPSEALRWADCMQETSEDTWERHHCDHMIQRLGMLGE